MPWPARPLHATAGLLHFAFHYAGAHSTRARTCILLISRRRNRHEAARRTTTASKQTVPCTVQRTPRNFRVQRPYTKPPSPPRVMAMGTNDALANGYPFGRTGPHDGAPNTQIFQAISTDDFGYAQTSRRAARMSRCHSNLN